MSFSESTDSTQVVERPLRSEHPLLRRIRELQAQSSPTDIPEDFGFVLKYGVKARNVLDTFEGTFTKDLIRAGTKTTELVLSKVESQVILEEIQSS